MTNPLIQDPKLSVFRANRLAEFQAAGARTDFACRFKPSNSPVNSAPLNVGSKLLGLLGMRDTWMPATGCSLPPHHSLVLTVEHGFVFSSSGIVSLSSGEVIEETLDHTSTEIDGFERLPDDELATNDGGRRAEGGLVLLPAPACSLVGKYVSFLIGSYENYFHWLFMSLGRLGLLDDEDTAGLTGILIPADLPPNHLAAARLLQDRLGVPLQAIERGKGYRVERLVVPWNVFSNGGADAAAIAALRGLVAEDCEPHIKSRERSIYIDRRGAWARRLLNEEEVILQLERAGIEPVELDSLTLQQQAAVFRQAKLIVAPHGAGLTNMVFSAPGTMIVELMPSETMNWCYRTLAASCGHSYDAVIGRTHSHNTTSKHEPWAVSVTHILAALDDMRARAG